MNPKPDLMIEEDVSPIMEVDCALPEKLVMKFADNSDSGNVEIFLKEQKQHVPCWEFAIEEGRAVIFEEPDTGKIYGLGCAQKIVKEGYAPFIEVYEPVSALPWVAINQMMVAALTKNEYIRAVEPTLVYKGRVSDSIYYKTFDADDYLARAAKIESVSSGKSTMSLHLQPLFDGLQVIEYIRHSLSHRCGA